MSRTITTKCARTAQKDNDDIVTLVGGSVQEEDGTIAGFISFKVGLGNEDSVEVTEVDPVIIIPESDSITYLYLDDEFIILVGTKDGGKPYASRLLINDNNTADATQFGISDDISTIRKTLPFHIGNNNAYVSIGDKDFNNGARTSIISLFDKELNQKKTITTIDGSSGEALLVSLYDIIIYHENIFVGGVIHPTEAENPLGVIIKFDNELNVINHSIISGLVSKATVVRAFDIVDDILIALIEIRGTDNEAPGVLLKRFDMDLREVTDPEAPGDTPIVH